jgi:23S rRNA (uracil1939-C5)-methyltransferase
VTSALRSDTMGLLRFDATIESLAPGGDGVAHASIAGERRAVFVPRSAPGDVLRLEVDPSKRPARGRALDVLVPGAGRVAPACAWAARCGGCDWMHLSLEAQAQAHVEHVRAAMPAPWRQSPIVSHAAPATLAYRSRLRVHARADRRGHVVVGMHEAGTHEPVEVETCAVIVPALETVRRRLPALLGGSSGHGEVRLALGVQRLPVIDVTWTGELAPSVFARLEQAVAGGEIAGAHLRLDGAARPAPIGDPTPWVVGPDGEPLQLAASGFAQPSEGGSAALARHVAELVGPAVAKPAVELYAGAGNLTVLLVRAASDLVAVEAHRGSCEAARANLIARGLRARVVEGDADTFPWPARIGLLVLDPPRTGARSVAERLAGGRGHRPERVVYISCDPQTLKRDLEIIEPHYTATSIAAFELFPQTSHVETVVGLALQRRRP